MIQVLDRLFSTIVARRNGDPTKSHTAALFQKGRGHIARKVGEEATETIVAAMEGNRAAVISESADVLFHLMVLWADQGIAPAAGVSAATVNPC